MVPIWIFTANGFFTFVTDRKDPNYLWLRARMREHLEDNFPGVTAEEHPGADYLYRAKVKRVDVAQRIADLVMESRIDSHFKDVMIKTAAKPKTGSLSNVMYAVWRGAAEWQPYAPNSKVPRGQEPKFKYTGAQGHKGTGSTLPAYSSYGDRKASDFDWNTYDWSRKGTPVGDSARDDDGSKKIKTSMGDMTFEDISELPNDLYVAVLDGMSQTELDAFLGWADDEQADTDVLQAEAEMRSAELAEEHPGLIERWYPSPTTFEARDWGQVEADRREVDRQRQSEIRSSGRKGRKRGRKNRHNQKG